MNGRAARLSAIGVVTGLAGGLLGVGGGFVMVPAMVYLLKTPQREANGTSLAVIVPVALVGATVLGRGHQVDVEVAIALAIGAVGGAVVGARMTRRVSDAGLRRAFGVLAIVVGLLMIGEAALHALGTPIHFGATLRLTGLSLWGLAFVVGAVAGILSGLLGIGGGAIMIPAMTLLMGLSQHLAQGTSLLVIIPTRDNGTDLGHFVESLRHHAERPEALRLSIVDNGSRDAATLRILGALSEQSWASVLKIDEPFNWARLNNRAVAASDTPLLVFANDDMAMLSDGWDQHLRGLLERPEIGAVGARLIYPDDTIQHAGILLGWEGRDVHDGRYEALTDPGPGQRWHVSRAVSAADGCPQGRGFSWSGRPGSCPG